MCAKVSAGHPSNTVYGYECYDTRTEYLAVAYVLSLDVAGQENHSCNEEHNHLNDNRHGDRFHNALGIREMRQQIGEITQAGNYDNPGKEDVHCTVISCRQFLVQQGFRITIHIVAVFRILDEFLEAFIIGQFLTTAVRPERTAEHAKARCRNGNSENLEHRVVEVMSGEEANDGHNSYRYRGSTDSHLGSHRSHSHRTLRTNVLLDCDIIDNREHGINHMTRTTEYRQEPSGKRSKNRNLLRIATQEFFCILQHNRKTTRSL